MEQQLKVARVSLTLNGGEDEVKELVFEGEERSWWALMIGGLWLKHTAQICG